MAQAQDIVSTSAHCPFNSPDWDRAGPVRVCCARAKGDIAKLSSQPVPGVHFVPKEDDFTCVQAIIIGNSNTPYEGGFFHFYIRFGPQYPFQPPRVCAMSCYRFGHKVRFNPNMYEDGTVCLSILGTWRGPAWTAANNLAGVLLSIQSLFCDQALCNEPGYSNRRDTGDECVQMYDVYVRHETLRVAVIHSIEFAKEYKVPPELIKVMKCSFMEYYDSYIASCDALAEYDGQTFQITLRAFHTFSPNFSQLKAKLVLLHAKLLEEEEAEEDPPSGDESFIKDNTPAPCSSPESFLSGLSDDDSSPNSCGTPSKDKTSQDSTEGSSLPEASEAESHEDAIASTDNETQQRNSSKLEKIDGLSSDVPSFLNRASQGASLSSKKFVKPNVPNSKVANVVKIDSAPCEKILKELSSVGEAVPSTSNWLKMEQCLDFLSFLAESEWDHEELSDCDQPSEDEGDGNTSEGDARITEGNSAEQEELSAAHESGLLCESLTQNKSSPSAESYIKSGDVRSVEERTEIVISKKDHRLHKVADVSTRECVEDDDVSDRGCAEKELKEDSDGRGLKRKKSGVTNIGLVGEREKCPSPSLQ